MTTRIALFRGINVGGNHLLPMAELAAILEDLGASEVRTSGQSGNAVFRCRDRDTARFAERLAAEVSKRRGFEPRVFVVAPEILARAMADNPFPDAVGEPATLHLGFLAAKPEPRALAGLSELRTGRERFHLGDGVLYLHLPDGAGRSKLAAGAEKCLGVAMTARNWRTVCRLAEMAGARAGRGLTSAAPSDPAAQKGDTP